MLSSVVKQLNSIGIDQSQVLTHCCADLNADCLISFSWLVLTDTKIIKIQNRSVIADFTALPYCDDDADITLYDRCECSEIKSVFNVSGITLSMMYKGEAVLLALSSNRFMPQIKVFEYAAAENIVMPVKEKTSSSQTDQTDKEKHHNGFTSIGRVFNYYKPYKWKVVMVFVFVFLSAAMDMFTPFLSGKVLFGDVLDSKAPGITATLLLLVLSMLVIKIINQFTYAATAFANARITPFVIRDIKSDIFKKMSSLSVGFYHSRETGTLMTRVLDDANRVSGLLIDNLPYVTMDLFTLVSVVAIMIALNWKMAIAALILMPLSTVISLKMMPQMFTLHGKQYRALRKLNSHLNDNLTGSRVVRAFGQEEKEKSVFSVYSKNIKTAEMNLVKTDNKIHALFAFVREIGTIIVYALGGYLILSKSGEFSYASLITFTGYASMLSGPLENMAFLFRQYSDFSNASERIFEILDTPAQIKEKEHPVHLENPKGEIELCKVSFSYETGKPVLQNISFQAHGNQLLGIVGYSGAGKTTLLNLISRLYDVDSGSITIDGIDIRDIALDDLRRLIAVVSQETYIFIGTVAENIAYANPDVSREDIIKAAMAASAHDFIMKMPDGYDTVIGASGRELSGGERQRISIARAILSNPKILILDEATASVDTKTEINIQNSLEKLIQGRTAISVAHRLSTLRDADALIVMDKGKVVESGTHDELMAENGLYRELAQLQTQQMIMKGE